ncbi:hypothetical protein [Streptomyces sp. NPDC048639]|uniref:hypothetical protein n=1 Tax=Streptomyces sp. NPDC048639 TaxID=3365581 RepID=UPI00371C7B81
MTVQADTLHGAAARAALDVPGVQGLQPGLGYRLAAAARGVQSAHASTAPPEAGIRADHIADPPGWQVEVRCIIDEERRALDTARDVRERVRTAVTAQLAREGTPEPVAVLVTITRTEPTRAGTESTNSPRPPTT